MSKYQLYGVVKKEIDDMQIKLSCCGKDGFKDWFEEDWHDKLIG